MSNEIEKFNHMPMQKIAVLAESMNNSGVFGIKSKDMAFCYLMTCDAMNVHPALLHLKYHIMKDGKLAKKDSAVLSDFLESGGKVEFTIYNDSECEGVFSHPKGATIPPIKWTLEAAKKAGLLEKQDTAWLKYPRAMLKARVIAEGVRLCYPQALNGMYTQTELQDIAEEREVKGQSYIRKPKFSQKSITETDVINEFVNEAQGPSLEFKINRISEICSKLEGAQEWLQKVLENNGGKSLEDTDEIAIDRLLSKLEQRLMESQRCAQ